MPRVICELPNASELISGVRFQKLEDGRFISDEIGDEATQIFLSIPGYVPDEEGAEAPEAPEAPPAKTKAQITAEKKAAKAEKAAAAAQPDTAPVTEPAAEVVTEPAAETLVTEPASESTATESEDTNVF